MSFTIVGRRFDPAGFAAYVAGITLAAFRPAFIVLHNTSSPTLDQRPNGLTPQHLGNMQQYYADQGWNGGPHLFVDDRGIWVFNPLDRRGTHSPSWNALAWGVEMLGDYDSDSFDSGRGALVRDNAVAALAVLCRKLGVERPTAETIRFHKQDPLTTHKDCPGAHVSQTDIVARVAAAMSAAIGYDLYLNATRLGTCRENPDDQNRNWYPVRSLLNAVFGEATVVGALSYDSTLGLLRWNRNTMYATGADGEVHPLPCLARDAGTIWVQVRAIASWLGLEIAVDDAVRRIVLSRKGAAGQ